VAVMYLKSIIIKSWRSPVRRAMLREESVPCQKCATGLHRICASPVPIPTLLAYLKGRKNVTTETLTCCDRKEFWTSQVCD